MDKFQAMTVKDLRAYMLKKVADFKPTVREVSSTGKTHQNWKTKTAMLKELAKHMRLKSTSVSTKKKAAVPKKAGIPKKKNVAVSKKAGIPKKTPMIPTKKGPSATGEFKYKYKKKMSQLGKEDFKTMRKDDLKALLRVPNPGMAYAAYPTPNQSTVITYKGLSASGRDELVKYFIKARNQHLRNKRDFIVWNPEKRMREFHPDPVVEWGNYSAAEKRAAGYLPPRQFEIGDLITETKYDWQHPSVYRVVGYTSTGRPKLHRLPLISLTSSENQAKQYQKSSYITKKYMPDLTSSGTAEAFKTATGYKKWDGAPVEATVDYGR